MSSWLLKFHLLLQSLFPCISCPPCIFFYVLINLSIPCITYTGRRYILYTNNTFIFLHCLLFTVVRVWGFRTNELLNVYAEAMKHVYSTSVVSIIASNQYYETHRWPCSTRRAHVLWQVEVVHDEEGVDSAPRGAGAQVLDRDGGEAEVVGCGQGGRYGRL